MKAWKFLDNSSKWTQGESARDLNGNKTDPFSPDAVCWCLYGLVNKCYHKEDGTDDELFDVLLEIDRHVIKRHNKVWGYQWNDAPERTWEDVRNLLKELDI